MNDTATAPAPVWVPIEAVTPMLGCTVGHARLLAREGRLPGAGKLPGSRRWLVDLRVLNASLDVRNTRTI